MKVRTYIAILSSASLGGAILVGVFGWWMLSGINQSNRELEQESRNSGDSSSEYQDIHAFLAATRGCFEAVEIYPPDFVGIYGVVRDRIILAKEGLNLISRKYSNNYPDGVLRPLAAGIRELEGSITQIEKASISKARNRGTSSRLPEKLMRKPGSQSRSIWTV